MKLWKVFAIAFIFCNIVGILIGMLGELTWNEVLIFNPAISFLMSILTTMMAYLGRSVDKFSERAQEVEDMIRAGEDKSIVYPEILNLRDSAPDPSCAGRVRELAKMYEIKYNETIIRK